MAETKTSKTLTTLDRMFTEADRARDTIAKDKKWDKAMDLLRGKHLPENRPTWKPDAILNMLRTLVERKTAMLTDTKPNFNIAPRKEGTKYSLAANMLKQTADAWWEDSGMDMTIARLIVFAQVFGTGITQTRWSKGDGEIVIDVEDTRRVLVDPSISDPAQAHTAEYVILEEFPSIAEMKMKFPRYADKFQPFTAEIGEKQNWLKRITNMMSRNKDKVTEAAVPRTYIRHYWIKDYEVKKKEVKTFDDAGASDKSTLYEREYPGGRYLIWTQGDTIIHDAQNPYMDYTHPFDILDWYTDLDTIWGDSEVIEQMSPQTLVNKLTEIVVENAMLMNNSIWICDSDAFPDSGLYSWNQLTNRAGNIIRKRRGSEIRRDTPAPMPPDMQNFIKYLQQFIESQAGGMESAGRGGSVGQIQSGLGVEQLQMAATAMIRLKARSVEALIQRIGQRWISRALQFYTNDRVFSFFGPGGEFEQFSFIRQKLKDAIDAPSLRDAMRDFKFKVLPGSSLAMSKIQKALVASQLFQAGIIDREEVLKTIEWPDWKNVLQRTMESQQEGMEGGKGGHKRGRMQHGTGGIQRKGVISGRN